MAKVYALAKELKTKLPKVIYKNFNFAEENKKEQEFLALCKTWVKKFNPDDKLAGEEYAIQHADGYARYIVLSSKPVKLMHLPLGDAWDSPWADRTRKSDLEQYFKFNQRFDDFRAKHGGESKKSLPLDNLNQ